MIAIDTNIAVRFLTQDDESQYIAKIGLNRTKNGGEEGNGQEAVGSREEKATGKRQEARGRRFSSNSEYPC